jgi:hypothetical protein
VNVIDIDVLFHGLKIKVKHDRVHVRGKGLYDVRILGRNIAYIGFEKAGARQFKPVQARLWHGSVVLTGPGEDVTIARASRGIVGEIRGEGLHSVIEVQDGLVKSQVRRLVEGL